VDFYGGGLHRVGGAVIRKHLLISCWKKGHLWRAAPFFRALRGDGEASCDCGINPRIDFGGQPANAPDADVDSLGEFAFAFEAIYLTAAEQDTVIAQFRK
jgi:hypothetical protein